MRLVLCAHRVIQSLLKCPLRFVSAERMHPSCVCAVCSAVVGDGTEYRSIIILLRALLHIHSHSANGENTYIYIHSALDASTVCDAQFYAFKERERERWENHRFYVRDCRQPQSNHVRVHFALVSSRVRKCVDSYTKCERCSCTASPPIIVVRASARALCNMHIKLAHNELSGRLTWSGWMRARVCHQYSFECNQFEAPKRTATTIETSARATVLHVLVCLRQATAACSNN